MKSTRLDKIRETDWLNTIKGRFKKYPKLYYFIIRYMSPVLPVGKPLDTIVAHVPEGDSIINIGSGPRTISEKVINVDISSYENISVVADAHHLPFKDNSVGGIINIAMLEHVVQPHAAVQEMLRVLKPGGYVHFVTPFIQGFHASPHDYYRWTSEGIKKLFNGFDLCDKGISLGPTTSLLLMVQEWLALFFSFRSKTLYRVLWIAFQILLTPLKYIDLYLVKHPHASNIASAFYFIGKKKNEE